MPAISSSAPTSQPPAAVTIAANVRRTGRGKPHQPLHAQRRSSPKLCTTRAHRGRARAAPVVSAVLVVTSLIAAPPFRWSSGAVDSADPTGVVESAVTLRSSRSARDGRTVGWPPSTGGSTTSVVLAFFMHSVGCPFGLDARMRIDRPTVGSRPTFIKRASVTSRRSSAGSNAPRHDPKGSTPRCLFRSQL